MRKALIFPFIYSTNISLTRKIKRIKEGRKAGRVGARETGLFQFILFSQGGKSRNHFTVNLSIFLLSGRRNAVLAHFSFWMLSRQILNTKPLSAHIISLLLDLIWETPKVKLPLWGPPDWPQWEALDCKIVLPLLTLGHSPFVNWFILSLSNHIHIHIF